LQRKLGTTFVVVTHDQDEAMTLADRIGVMNHGNLVQVGAPAEIYERPNSRWVADFVGDVNLIEGRVSGDGRALDTANGALRLAGPASPAGAAPGKTVWLALRPEKIRIGLDRPSGNDNVLAGA